jgi:hypothetical protein
MLRAKTLIDHDIRCSITGDYTAARRTASVVWHALQAITECLIMCTSSQVHL